MKNNLALAETPDIEGNINVQRTTYNLKLTYDIKI
ncbi:MAG: hypothetical protein JWQ14_2847 [Adhaeribacter sp.]|jgi:hypothetical protein|nr:hypothetical protein [Adhaeribacter sp.]